LLRTVGGGGRSASLEPELRRARGAAEEEEQQDGGRLGFSQSAEGKVQTAPTPAPFYRQGAALRETRNPTGRDASGNPQSDRVRRFGKPAIQLYAVHQRSHQKPPRNHFERVQRLRHLATSSAPGDFVELVPRRANVGAKAKTPPFARGLRCSRWSDRDKTGEDTLRSIRHQTKACGDAIPRRGLVQL
jgi:hypothetical protein